METTIRQPIQSAEPTSEPLTSAEVKKHLEVSTSTTAHDTQIGTLIEAARYAFEADTGIATITRTFVEYFDRWPCEDVLTLQRRPVSAITSIQYVDQAGTTQTLSSSCYTLDTAAVVPGVYLNYGETWPTIRGQRRAVIVTYVAGYSSSTTLPELHKQAMLMWIAARFYNRQGDDPFGITADPKYQAAYDAIVRRLVRSTYP